MEEEDGKCHWTSTILLPLISGNVLAAGSHGLWNIPPIIVEQRWNRTGRKTQGTHTHTQQTNGKQLFLSSLGLVLICLRVFDVQVRGHARKHHPLRSEYRHRAHRRPGCSLRMCCRHITLTTHVGAEGGLSGHTEDLLLWCLSQVSVQRARNILRVRQTRAGRVANGRKFSGSRVCPSYHYFLLLVSVCTHVLTEPNSINEAAAMLQLCHHFSMHRF